MRSEEIALDLTVWTNVASLHLHEGFGNTDATLMLPVDPDLGPNDPNVLVLRAMQDAGTAEVLRQRRGPVASFVHAPQALDLSDLQRFPSAA